MHHAGINNSHNQDHGFLVCDLLILYINTKLFSRTCVQYANTNLPIFLSKPDMADIACTLPSFLQHVLPPTSVKPCIFL